MTQIWMSRLIASREKNDGTSEARRSFFWGVFTSSLIRSSSTCPNLLVPTDLVGLPTKRSDKSRYNAPSNRRPEDRKSAHRLQRLSVRRTDMMRTTTNGRHINGQLIEARRWIRPRGFPQRKSPFDQDFFPRRNHPNSLYRFVLPTERDQELNLQSRHWPCGDRSQSHYKRAGSFRPPCKSRRAPSPSSFQARQS